MTVAADPASEADRAVARGDLDQASRLLEQLVARDPTNGVTWLQLAGLHRAAGRSQQALTATDRALALSPLDFTALVMRAGLLERLDPGEAGKAWSHALAQRPAGELPPPLAKAVAHGEKCCDAWLDASAAAMTGAVAPLARRADPEERQRIARFQSNILRRTRPYHSEPTAFHYPGLVEREFHSRRQFLFLEELEASTETIANEFQAVMRAERAELEPYIQYEAHAPMAQWKALNQNPDWTAIHLIRNGQDTDANTIHCPRTMALLDRVGQPRIAAASPNAMFSLLAPHTVIPPHVGISNARLVCHLPLIVPPGCWFRVGAETRPWRRGEAFVFDDTIEHEAANPTDELRVVLIFDVWHPDLTALEREAVAAVIPNAEGKPSGDL